MFCGREVGEGEDPRRDEDGEQHEERAEVVVEVVGPRIEPDEQGEAEVEELAQLGRARGGQRVVLAHELERRRLQEEEECSVGKVEGDGAEHGQ